MNSFARRSAPIEMEQPKRPFRACAAQCRPLARSHEPCANAQRSGCRAIDRIDGRAAERGTFGIPTTIAADLVALLPRGNSLNVHSSVRLFAPAGPRQTQILMVLSAFAIMTLIVFAISAADPGGPGIGENPLPPRANDATMVMRRR